MHTQNTPRPMPIAFMVSIWVAIAFNALGIAMFSDVVAQWREAGGSQSPAAVWITAVTVPHQAQLLADSAATPLQAAPKLDTAEKSSVAPAQSHTPMQTDRKTVLPSSQGAPEPARFYRTGEVDTPAFPDSDWNLDPGVLDVVRLDRLVFEVYINDRGEIVKCSVLEPQQLATQTRTMLEDRLQQTKLQPATRAGQPVPSVRRIELSVVPSIG